MPARTKLAAAALALCLAGVACADASTPADTAGGPSSSDPPSTATPSNPKPTKTTASPGVDVPELLDLEAPLLDGGTFRGADLAGDDVAFWFWAPW